MNYHINFPQGTITDQTTGQLALEWFMFLQQLNNGVAFAIQQANAAAGFSSVMLGNDSVGDSENSMMGMIPGPIGATGARGLFVPGMDGQDGADEYGLLGWPNPLFNAEPVAWTPTDQSGAGLALTVVAADCIVFTVGQLVFCYVDFTFPATASGADILIGGLPYTSRNSTNNIADSIIDHDASGATMMAQVVKNSTTFTIKIANTTQINSTFSGAHVRGCLIYPVKT